MVEGLDQAAVHDVIRPEQIERAGDVLVRQAFFQDGGQVLDAPLDEPFGLERLRIELAVDELRPAEEEGVRQEQLQIDQGLGPGFPGLFPEVLRDLGEQGFDGLEVVVVRIQPVLGNEAQGVQVGRGLRESESVEDPGREEIPGPVEIGQDLGAAERDVPAIDGPGGPGRTDPGLKHVSSRIDRRDRRSQRNPAGGEQDDRAERDQTENRGRRFQTHGP